MADAHALLATIAEYLGRVEDLYAHYLDSRYGYARSADFVQRKVVQSGKRGDGDQLPLVYGIGDPNNSTAAVFKITQREFIERNSVGGRNHLMAGQFLLVNLFSVWEHEYRPRTAAALGLARPNDLKVPIMGDLRKFRNDVLHSKGKRQESLDDKLEVVPGLFVGDRVAPEWEQLLCLLTVIRSCLQGLTAQAQ